jgi:isopentenyldiphosphate isomerase
MDNSREIMDVVSDSDEVLYQAPRSQIYTHKLHFRAINGFLINKNNQLWIPIRHPSKKLWPLHWDASVAGHVIAGETYEEAFIRETQEELALDATNLEYRVIDRLTPMSHGTSAFMYVYLIPYDQEPSYNKEDMVGGTWLYPDEILNALANGQKAKSDLPKILKAVRGKL